MYDYISLYSDDKYSKKIKTEVFESYLSKSLGLKKDSSLKFSKEFNGINIRLTGIMSNENGSYAYDTLDGVEEINLIEIDIPDNVNAVVEKEITKIAFAIAKEFSWCVYDQETSSKIYP